MNDVSLKAKVRNIAKDKKISAQAVLQNYLMRRFLFRLSKSEYKDKFVVKGGILISVLVGVDHRATMDIDITLRNLSLTEDSIRKAFENICNVDVEDGLEFSFDSIGPIRDDEEYGGYRVSFFAKFGKINAPMSMDVSTGDVMTPDAKKYTFSDMFNDDCFELWTYTIETVLAEKVETILSRGIDNTRPRDFYDICVLSAFDYDNAVFRDAFKATSKHRGSFDKIVDYDGILVAIENDFVMQNRWKAYSSEMIYAKDISFAETIAAIRQLMK